MSRVTARHASGARAVQGGGKVRDPCVWWVGWMGCACGGEGGREPRTRIDLGRLVQASKNKKMKVTSDLQVPGHSRSWDPASALPATHRVCARACTCRRVPSPHEKGCPALLGNSCEALQSKGLGQTFPTLSRSEAWLVGDPSVGWRGAVQERRAKLRRSRACSTSAWDTESMAPPKVQRGHFKAT